MSEFSADSGYDHGSSHSEGGGESHIYHDGAGDLLNYNLLGGDIQYYNFQNLIEGLRINNGIRFSILFIAFFGWLYIVYWLRHHEPLKHQAIGMSTVSTVTTPQDKSIIASIKNCFPLKTSADFGTLYVPTPEDTPPENQYMAPRIQSKETQPPITGQPGQAISAPLTYTDPDFDQRFGYAANSKFMTKPIINSNYLSDDPIIKTVIDR